VGAIAVNETAARFYGQGSADGTSSFITADLKTGKLVYAYKIGANLEEQLTPQLHAGRVFHMAFGNVWWMDAVTGKLLGSRGAYNYNLFLGPRFAIVQNVALFLTMNSGDLSGNERSVALEGF